MFDAHTHLNGPDLYPQRRELVQRFVDAGGIGLINIGVNHTYNTNGLEICKQSKKLIASGFTLQATIGLHPCEVTAGHITTENIDQKLNELKSLYNPTTHNSIVALGEMGIDTYRPDTDHTIALQKELFRRQCEWAREINLPIVIHSRANREATHDILQDFTDLTIYFHCRSYTPDEIQIIQNTYPDFYIGFTGNITYPKAIDIRASLRYLVYGTTDYPDHVISGRPSSQEGVGGDHKHNLPSELYKPNNFTNLTNLLIETDAPYLPPVPQRGKPNEPAFIAHTYAYISSLLGIDITDHVVNNTKRCYTING